MILVHGIETPFAKYILYIDWLIVPECQRAVGCGVCLFKFRPKSTSPLADSTYTKESAPGVEVDLCY